MTIRPIIFSTPMVRALLDGRKTQTRRLVTSPLRRCKVGDRLWVKETWQVGMTGNAPGITYRATPDYFYPDWKGKEEFPYEDYPAKAWAHGAWIGDVIANDGPWSTALHCPRWASRLSLDVVKRRAQALQWISDEDAIAEGVQKSQGGMWCGGPHCAHGAPRQWNTPRDAYFDLWDSLHGEGAAKANPDVVALSFIVHQKNVDAMAGEAA